VQYKSILALVLIEIKCHVNTFLGLVGGCKGCIPPVSAPDTLGYLVQVVCFISESLIFTLKLQD